MPYETSFGRLTRAPRAAATGARFRLALLGDFSGRANAGRLETGPALATRKPIKVDADNIDRVLAGMQLSLALPVAEDDDIVEIPINSLDDFHPDQLVENVELFEHLLGLRHRLASRTGFDKAAKEVLSWANGARTGVRPGTRKAAADDTRTAANGARNGARNGTPQDAPADAPAGAGNTAPLPRRTRQARGAAIAADRRLADLARLTGRPTGRPTSRLPSAHAETAAVDTLLRHVVGPFVQLAGDPRQDRLTARVDEALSAAMRRVLHHPDFQAAEALWRGLDFLVRRIDTGPRMEIVLYDVSAEEFAADLAATETLEDTGLYQMLVEQPAMDAGQGALSAIVGLYGFELIPPHADLLGRAASIAAAARAPFLAGIGPDPLKVRFDDQHPLIRQAWSALQALPAAAYLGLAAPRFLLRPPYGRKSDPIDSFQFEEFTPQSGLGGMLWGHPALLAGLLLSETWLQQGAKMQVGSVMGAGDMPYFVYTGPDGDQVALPCTERLYSEREAVQVAGYRVMPVLSLRGRPQVRLGGFTSLAGGTLAGFWAPVDIASSTAAVAPAVSPAAAAPAAVVADPAASFAAGAEERARENDDAATGGSGLAADEAPAPADGAAPSAAALDELDSLLASLSPEPASPASPDAPEAELDALLAALK